MSPGDCAIAGTERKKLAAQRSNNESELTVDVTRLYRAMKILPYEGDLAPIVTQLGFSVKKNNCYYDVSKTSKLNQGLIDCITFATACYTAITRGTKAVPRLFQCSGLSR